MITKEQCKDLAVLITELREQDSFYRYKFTYHRIAHATGLPQGSLDYYIVQRRLPPYRYAVLAKYVEEVLTEHKTWIENPNPLINNT
jgi:hypothetical protein